MNVNVADISKTTNISNMSNVVDIGFKDGTKAFIKDGKVG